MSPGVFSYIHEVHFPVDAHSHATTTIVHGDMFSNAKIHWKVECALVGIQVDWLFAINKLLSCWAVFSGQNTPWGPKITDNHSHNNQQVGEDAWEQQGALEGVYTQKIIK